MRFRRPEPEQRPSWEIIRRSLSRGDCRTWRCRACDVVNSYPPELRAEPATVPRESALPPDSSSAADDGAAHSATSQSRDRQIALFFTAVGKGDFENVKALLTDAPDLVFGRHEVQSLFWTPLHVAALSGRKSVVELLVANKADVNAKDIDGQTPMHFAAKARNKSGAKEVAALLLAHGAKVYQQDNAGNTPLHIAASGGLKDVAELLLAQGPEQFATLRERQGLAMTTARAEAVIVNGPNRDGDTPLHMAAYFGRKDLVELLLAHKADCSAENRSGHTPDRTARYRAWEYEGEQSEAFRSIEGIIQKKRAWWYR